ncbi:MAG TPA: hypothetical protein VNC78_04870 [Actinomycetota bacterium]|nr:hypothetical protein [Actinomycetota bacterium]
MANMKYLGIYLNDHLAGSVAGIELAKRIRGENEGTPLGEFLAEVIPVIEEDQQTVILIMEELGVARSPIKAPVAWVAERLGRLKLNGELTGYSPLSRVVELEGLLMGVQGRASLWKRLASVPIFEGPIASIDPVALAARADENISQIQDHLDDAARAAFAEPADAGEPSPKTSVS